MKSHIKPIGSATYKNFAHDFIVTEVLPFTPIGFGEHLYLFIQKQNLNTHFVAKLLAKWAHLAPNVVAFSGLKDRHGITCQWFSLPINPYLTSKYLANAQLRHDACAIGADFDAFCTPFLKNSEYLCTNFVALHNKKLRRSTHRFNHFCICLRDVVVNDAYVQNAIAIDDKNSAYDAANHHIHAQIKSSRRITPHQICDATTDTIHHSTYHAADHIKHGAANQNFDIATHLTQYLSSGFANFFGAQRFGKDNVQKFCALNPKRIKNGRRSAAQSLMISAAKSFLFNQILDARLKNNTWRTPIAGDVFMLAHSHSIFCAAIDDDIKHRCNIGQILITGALFGKQNKCTSTKTAAAIEQAVFDKHPHITQKLLQLGEHESRRPLCVYAKNFQVYSENNALMLNFLLPAGAYATALLDFIADRSIDKSLSMQGSKNDACSDANIDVHHTHHNARNILHHRTLNNMPYRTDDTNCANDSAQNDAQHHTNGAAHTLFSGQIGKILPIFLDDDAFA